MKKREKIKKVSVLCLVFLLSINSFAAIVSDNDGSAFVTKAEFDALKNSFNKQIDNYNTSIDEKIDGAIAAYLAGLSLSRLENLSLDQNSLYTFPIIMDKDNNWNNTSSPYYSVSTPEVYVNHYKFISDKMVGSNYFEVDTETPALYEIEKPGYWRQVTAGMLIDKVESVPQDGFLNSVSGISGTRTIAGVAYGTRERLTAGIGHDVAYYIYDSGTGTSSGGVGYGDVTDPIKTFHYYEAMCMSGSTTNIGGGKMGLDFTKRNAWTSVWLSAGHGGNADNATHRIRTSAELGNTYKDNIDCINSLCGFYVPWAGSDWVAINDKPLIEVFNWSKTDQVTRLYAGGADCPANVQGNWSLIPPIGMSDATRLAGMKIMDNTEKYILGVTNQTTNDYYAQPFYNFRYLAWPYMIASDNVDFSPAADVEFSKLPASLVYWKDTKGEIHYLDEGMFLQKFTKNGEVTLDLRFSGDAGVRIKIHFSKKPFDREWVATDETPIIVDGTTYNDGYELDTSLKNVVSINIKNIVKNDKLYMFWEPTVSGKYCQLDELDNFRMLYQD